MRFVKGHGTANDFVLLPDHDGDLDPELVRALCDRRTGIGGDGVLQARPTDAGFFMDYRNSDGSPAEMCGNGIRVFARYLVSAGLAAPGRLTVGTLSGPRNVDVPADGGDITVDMGPAVRAADADVVLGGRRHPAAGWSMGNPHLVVLDAGPVAAVDLTVPPAVEPAAAYPDGVNVEVVERVGDRRLRMRVFERGAGETRSCGTGACAAAIAAMTVAGERACYDVRLPGGRLLVDGRDPDAVRLSGPAVLVARGEVDLEALLGATAVAAATAGCA